MNRLESAYGRLLEALALAACALIFGMTLMICADVLLRNVRIVPGMVGTRLGERDLGGDALPHHACSPRRGCCARASTSASTSSCARCRRRVGWIFEWLVDALGLACCALIA